MKSGKGSHRPLDGQEREDDEARKARLGDKKGQHPVDAAYERQRDTAKQRDHLLMEAAEFIVKEHLKREKKHGAQQAGQNQLPWRPEYDRSASRADQVQPSRQAELSIFAPRADQFERAQWAERDERAGQVEPDDGVRHAQHCKPAQQGPKRHERPSKHAEERRRQRPKDHKGQKGRRNSLHYSEHRTDTDDSTDTESCPRPKVTREHRIDDDEGKVPCSASARHFHTSRPVRLGAPRYESPTHYISDPLYAMRGEQLPRDPRELKVSSPNGERPRQRVRVTGTRMHKWTRRDTVHEHPPAAHDNDQRPRYEPLPHGSGSGREPMPTEGLHDPYIARQSGPVMGQGEQWERGPPLPMSWDSNASYPRQSANSGRRARYADTAYRFRHRDH